MISTGKDGTVLVWDDTGVVKQSLSLDRHYACSVDLCHDNSSLLLCGVAREQSATPCIFVASRKVCTFEAGPCVSVMFMVQRCFCRKPCGLRKKRCGGALLGWMPRFSMCVLEGWDPIRLPPLLRVFPPLSCFLSACGKY
mmetsp:Transcript_45834/g.93800  ORF Transcript_45834/g.93800 Transcript_45834/m.93800 type:complete len:140 (-) Transcript_45834:1164-1583(-)